MCLIMKTIINLLRKWVIKFFRKKNITDSLDLELLISEINKVKIDRCRKQVILGKGATFYEEANVYNLQNDLNKILIGDNTHIRGELLIFANGGKIHIGKNCYLGKGSYVWSGNFVYIGDSVLISHNCNIIDSDSHEIDYKDRHESYLNMLKNGHNTEKNNVKTDPIFIDNNVWISYNVSVLKGVKIGKGAIVAAGSVVTKDVLPFTLVAGNPAKFIKKIL